MLAIPVDRDSSAAPGAWEAGGFGFFLKGCTENIFSQLRLARPMSVMGDAILIDSPHKSGITRDAMHR